MKFFRRAPKVDLHFFGGIAVGLAFAAVTLVTAVVARRARMHAKERALLAESERMPVIDGVRPIEQAVLDALPAPEASSGSAHLASEAVDAPPLSQRW